MTEAMSMVRRFIPLFKLRICALITLSAVIGLVAASFREISAGAVFFLIVATMSASAAASALNHYFDRDIDKLMRRTSKRPLTSAETGGAAAVIPALVLLALSLAISFFALNYMVALHLFLGAFTYAIVYTVWLKRRSSLNIIVGGLAGSFAVLAGGASVSPETCVPVVLLAVVMFFWTPSHFWSFAIVHREEYERAGVPMLPTVVGDSKTAVYILVNTLLLVGSSLLPLYFGYLGLVYGCFAALAGAYFIGRNIELIVKTTKESAWKNFKTSMLYLAVLFMGVVLDVVIGAL